MSSELMLLVASYLAVVPLLAAFCENPECFLPKPRAKTSPRTDVNKQDETSLLWHSSERVTPGSQQHECQVRECIHGTITLFVLPVAVIG